ncbi:MAG: hypothetical protein RLN78_09160 [Phycisphaerales bacterium]
MRIAYVSCMELPEPDIDEKPMVEGLRAAGHDAVVVAWDDPDVDWGSFDVALVRATWNYIDDVEAFAAWIDRADQETVLLNSASTMKWNLHKGYLRDLESGGVPIVPTEFVHAGDAVDVARLSSDRGWDRIVIKPTVGAGSFGTRSFKLSEGESESAQSFFDSMAAQRDMMIQEFMDSVETISETALIVIDGQLTHAIEKKPRFDDQDESVLLRETISDEMREIADQVITAAGKEHLYARVDVMPGNDGKLLLSELEMLEPSLFFPYCADAVGVMVRGIEKRMASVQS